MAELPSHLRAIKIEVQGDSPLMYNNPAVADPLHPLAREMKQISNKRGNKTEADHAELSRLQYLASLYYDDQVGVYVPGQWLYKALMAAGGAMRKGSIRAIGGGTQVQRGLIGLAGAKVPLVYEGPRKPEDMFAAGMFDRRLVNGSPSSRGGSLVPRTRARFDEWGCVAEAWVDLEQLDLDALGEFLAFAGRLVGLGDARSLEMGRFNGRIVA